MYLDRIKINQLRRKLNKFRKMTLKDKSIFQIEKIIGKIILGHRRTLYTFNPSGLARARVNYDGAIFHNTKQVWYPDFNEIPKDKWKYRRCSTKGESVFYASTETDTVMIEMHPKNNTILTMVECIPKKGLLKAIVQVVGVPKLTEARNDFKTIFDKHYERKKKESEEYYLKNLLIDDFLNEHFTQDVSENEDYKYKISIAITRILMNAPDVVGIIYPSIAAKSKGANFVFKNEFVDANLQIVKAGMYKITHVEKSSISVNLINNPKSLCTEGLGAISWKMPEIDEMQEFTIQY